MNLVLWEQSISVKVDAFLECFVVLFARENKQDVIHPFPFAKMVENMEI